MEGFNLDKAIELVDAAEIGTMQKAALKASLGTVQNNPERLAEVLGRIRELLGFGA